MHIACMGDDSRRPCGSILPLPLWAWGARRTKVGGRGPCGTPPPPNPLPQGEGEDSSSGSPSQSRPRRHKLLAALLFGAGSVVSVAASAQTPDTAKPIFVLPPLQWDSMGVSAHIAVQQAPSDLARIMGGFQFGMKPEEVSQRLPKLGAELHWGDLPPAKEFSENVRLLRVPMQVAGALRASVIACFGDPSNVVLLFRDNALFRVSWRFLPGAGCPNPRPAAEQLFAAYVSLSAKVAISTYYRTGAAEVVDVTNPGAGPLIIEHWQARG
jgi:hypothetical protein